MKRNANGSPAVGPVGGACPAAASAVASRERDDGAACACMSPLSRAAPGGPQDCNAVLRNANFTAGAGAAPSTAVYSTHTAGLGAGLCHLALTSAGGGSVQVKTPCSCSCGGPTLWGWYTTSSIALRCLVP